VVSRGPGRHQHPEHGSDVLVLVKRFASDRELSQLPQLAVPFARWTRLETRLPTEPLSLK